MDTQTPPIPPGMLFAWMNVDSAHEQDFNRWFDREHLEERLRLPGFVSGTRYQNAGGPRKYLGLYRTTSLAVFKTAAYQQAFQHQTAWSMANLARMQNAMRRVCEIRVEVGAGTGAWLAILRLGTRAVGNDSAQVRELGTRLLALDGVIASRLLVPDVALSTPLPAENPVGRVLDPILLIEASTEPAAARAGRHAAETVGASIDDLSILQMMWQLRGSDLQTENAGS
jgi:hypothetical protein